MQGRRLLASKQGCRASKQGCKASKQGCKASKQGCKQNIHVQYPASLGIPAANDLICCLGLKDAKYKRITGEVRRASVYVSLHACTCVFV